MIYWTVFGIYAAVMIAYLDLVRCGAGLTLGGFGFWAAVAGEAAIIAAFGFAIQRAKQSNSRYY